MIAAMPDPLLRIHPDGRHEWLSGPGTAGARGGAAPNVVVPAEEVLLLEVERIPGSDATLARALPYAVEDQLAVPVETQHVAWAPLPDPSRIAVAVVARDTMRRWLDALHDAGMEPEALVPEGLLLPIHATRPTLLVEGDRAVARLGRTRVFCGRTDEVLALLPADTAVERIDVATPGGPARAIEVHARALAEGTPPMLNLLQGEFTPRKRRSDVRRGWTMVVGAAIAAVGLAIAHVGIERARLASQVEAQRAEMAGLYRQLVPGDGPVASAEAYLVSALRAAGQGEDPVLLALGTLSAALEREACCTLRSIDYRNRALDAVVDAPDVAALDALRARLAAGALPVELVAATPGSRGVEGRLRLGGDAR